MFHVHRKTPCVIGIAIVIFGIYHKFFLNANGRRAFFEAVPVEVKCEKNGKWGLKKAGSMLYYPFTPPESAADPKNNHSQKRRS